MTGAIADAVVRTLAITAPVAYLVGSIPFGLLLMRLAGGPDPRTVGSGNIGATNVVRAGGRGLGGMTLLLDAGKGFAAAWGARAWSEAAFDGWLSVFLGAWCGAWAVVGHCFPVWLKFRGGKGVATFLGAVLAFAPVAGLGFVAAYALAALGVRVASVASLAGVAVAVALVAALHREDGPVLAPTAVAAAVVAVRHASNLKRLVRGEEPRMGRRT